MGVPIAYSSRTHRVLIAISTYFHIARYLTGGTARGCPNAVLVAVVLRRGERRPSRKVARLRGSACPLLDELAEPLRVERPLEPEGPGKRPTADREVEAGRIGMQVCAPARQCTTGIRDADALDRRDTQQLVLGRALAAAHAGAFRACSDMRPARRRQVYPSEATWRRPADPEDRRGRLRQHRPLGVRHPFSYSGRPLSSVWPSVSGRMSIRQPVRRAARRAFCPSLPIASDSW